MASIKKIKDSYRIRVSCGYDVNGKQVIKSMNYKPAQGLSNKQIEKEVNRQAILFEEQCKHGQTVTAAKFETFARDWFRDCAELRLKRLTLCSYHSMEKRIYAALGHIRIDRISPIDIQKFVSTLVHAGLAPDNVKNHVRLVSVILNYAVKKRIITFNPCVTVTYPVAREVERDFYSKEEVRQMLALLKNEDESKKPFAVFFTLAAFMGARKGELVGLEWKDIDFENSMISINRAYYYSSHEKTYYTDTPKTKTSRRSLKMPAHVMDTLKEYREWQDGQREICGGSWVETDRLFTKWNGEPMTPNAPSAYLTAFCKRTGMRKVNVHSFRHFNASALIDGGVDVVAVQAALGHSTPATTMSIYSHAFDNAKTRAMEAIANAINL